MALEDAFLATQPRVPAWKAAADTVVAVWHRIGLAAILLIAAAFNLVGLDREGYANTYYAAAVKSMLTSWHNFFFVSFDAGGFVAVDKPPLGLWVQAASAKLFGFSGLSLLVPEALAGILSVGLLYYLVARTYGCGAGLLAALALAITPISVVTDRNNTIDSLLILTLLLGAWAALRAAETGRLRTLLLCALLVGLAFNIKMLQAYLVVPAFGLLYLLGAPLRWRTKVAHLTLAALVLLVVSLSWAVAVDLTPPGARPFVSDSGTNSELSLILGYNGLGRLTADLVPYLENLPFLHVSIDLSIMPAFAPQIGDPGLLRLFSQAIGGQASWLLPLALLGLLVAALSLRPRLPLERQGQALVLWGGWLLVAGAFFSTARFFHLYYLTMLAPPVAALGGIGLAVLWRDYRAALHERTWHMRWRGWLLPLGLPVTAAVQIYLLAPGTAWSVSLGSIIAGLCLLAAGLLGAGLLRLAVAFSPGTVLGVGRRGTHAAAAIGLLGVLIAPTAWAAVSVRDNDGAAWLPQAGPAQDGFGGGRIAAFGRARRSGAPFGGNPSTPPWQGQARSGQSGGTQWWRRFQQGGQRSGRFGGRGFGGQGALTFSGNAANVLDPALVRYLRAHQGRATYLVATTTSSYASLFILDTNQPAMALGGYQGWDRIVSPSGLARLVAAGTVRYFYLPDQIRGTAITSVTPPGGAANSPFGPTASEAHVNDDDVAWVQAHCTAVPAAQWQSPAASSSASGAGLPGQGSAAGAGFGRSGGMQLYDCAGVRAGT